MEQVATAGAVSDWQIAKANIRKFALHLLEAVARAAAMIVLIFTHSVVNWALGRAFSGPEWQTYHTALHGGAFVGFSVVYVMLMIDLGRLFWPFGNR